MSITRRLMIFKIEDGVTMSKHLDSFNELIVDLHTPNEHLDEARTINDSDI